MPKNIMLICWICFLTLQVQAASQSGIYFYRSPKSLFPSGQKSLPDLEKSKVETESDRSYLVQIGPIKAWEPSESILRDIDLAKEKTPANRPALQDKGLAINLILVSLRERPEWTSDSILILPALSRLELLETTGSWAHVKFHEDKKIYEGFVDLNCLVLKADFAAFALTAKNQWRPVAYRALNYLVLDHEERVPLNSVQQVVTRPELGIVGVKDDKLGLSLKSHVSIEKFSSGQWNVSWLKGHGKVYWQNQIPETTSSFSEALSTEQILNREITAVAFHPRNPQIGIVASHGIYLTTDGDTWKPIKELSADGPVAIGKNGEFVVGDALSIDGGKSFQRFVKWDELAHLIELNKGHSVPELHLCEVKFLGNKILELLLDTGTKKIRMQGQPFIASSWEWSKIQ